MTKNEAPKRPPVSKLADLLCVLNAEIRWIFDHDDLFLDEFAKGEFMELIEVSFISHHIKIVYTLDRGQYVLDTVAMDEYMDWRSRYFDTKDHIQRRL